MWCIVGVTGVLLPGWREGWARGIVLGAAGGGEGHSPGVPWAGTRAALHDFNSIICSMRWEETIFYSIASRYKTLQTDMSLICFYSTLMRIHAHLKREISSQNTCLLMTVNCDLNVHCRKRFQTFKPDYSCVGFQSICGKRQTSSWTILPVLDLSVTIEN